MADPLILPCNMDTLAERLRRRPAKPMGSPRVGSNPTGVDLLCPHTTGRGDDICLPRVVQLGPWHQDVARPMHAQRACLPEGIAKSLGIP